MGRAPGGCKQACRPSGKQAAANAVLLCLLWHSAAASRAFSTTDAQERCVTAAAGHFADSHAVFSPLPLYKWQLWGATSKPDRELQQQPSSRAGLTIRRWSNIAVSCKARHSSTYRLWVCFNVCIFITHIFVSLFEIVSDSTYAQLTFKIASFCTFIKAVVF